MPSPQLQPRQPDPAVIADRAKAHGWKANRYLEHDKERNLNKYDDNVKEKQDRVLNKFAIWHWDKSGRQTEFEQHKQSLLRHGAPIPPLHELKDFWRFYKDQSIGRLRERPTAPTLKARAKEFKGGYMRVTENLLSDEDTKEINYWIKHVLPYEEDSGVKDIMMPKYNYKPVDLDRHLDALYTRGDLGITHERTRFQFHLMILMFTNSGARKGGLLTDGIKYKDIHLVLERTDKGNRRFIFALDQRKVKNNKDPENNKFGVTGREHRVLRYNAVFLLLLLAIADDALDRGYFIQILKGNGDGPIEWRESALETPICRSVDRQGSVCVIKPMSEYVFLGIFKKLFMAEYGYSRASMHMIRREIGKQLDERYTEVERGQHLTQADKAVFGQSYVAFVSSCDGFAAFKREQSDHAAVEYFQGVSQFWQPGLPTKLPAALRDELSKHPDLIELNKSMKQAGTLPSKSRAARNQLNALRKRLERTALEEHRAKCFKDKRRERLLHGNRQNGNGEDEDPLNDLIPEKGRIAQAMMHTSPVEYVDQPSVMRDSLFLLRVSGNVYYRPQEEPKNDLCPYCGLQMNNLPPRNRCQHIHRCRRKSTALTLGVSWTDLKFCYFCMAFFTKDSWQEDCQNHLSHLKHCCSITYRHTLLRPAFCPVCIQADELPPSSRLQYWERDADAIYHIDEAHGWHWLCVQCNFLCDGRQSGLYHLADAHGFKVRNDRSIYSAITGLASDSKGDLEFIDLKTLNHTTSPPPVNLTITDQSLEFWERTCNISDTTLDPQLITVSDTNTDAYADSLPRLLSESTNSGATSSWDEDCIPEPFDDLMSEFLTFPPDVVGGHTGQASPTKPASVIDLTGDEDCMPTTALHLADYQYSLERCAAIDSDVSSRYPTCSGTSDLPPPVTGQNSNSHNPLDASVERLPQNKGDSHVQKSKRSSESVPKVDEEQEVHDDQTNQTSEQALLMELKRSSKLSSMGVNRPTTSTGSTAGPLSKRTIIKLHCRKRSSSNGNDKQAYAEQPDRKRPKNNVYKVSRYLAIWGKIFLEWEDGTTGWEPKRNILDKEGLALFLEGYRGIDEGVDILDIRATRARGCQFLLHWHGRPESEDRWVDEKYMKRDRIEEELGKLKGPSMPFHRNGVKRSYGCKR